MGIRVIVAPGAEPVSLDEAKTHLRVDHDADDAYINGLIVAARRLCEKRAGRAFVTQTIRYTLDRFPRDRVIEIPYPPLQSVLGVTYKDVTGTVSTLDPTAYAVDADGFVGRIALQPLRIWPVFIPWGANAVTITFVAGYGDTAATVPQTIKQAILLLVGHWYENREAVAVGTTTRPLEFAVDALLSVDVASW